MTSILLTEACWKMVNPLKKLNLDSRAIDNDVPTGRRCSRVAKVPPQIASQLQLSPLSLHIDFTLWIELFIEPLNIIS
jgi:hypothetical protein